MKVREEGFRSVVARSKDLTKISRNCCLYALSRKSRIVIEEIAVSRQNFQRKLRDLRRGFDGRILV
ncbi:unnamed protein product [Musa textilis]